MLSRRFGCVLALACGVALVPGPGWADVKMPAVFADHMVLQRQMPVPVWGWADPAEQVTVTLGEQAAKATAGAQGKWAVKIGPLAAGGPHELRIAGKNTVVIKDVLVGEVWLCSGQSNMAMTVRGCLNAKEDISAAKLDRIRHFRVGRGSSYMPESRCSGSWAVCSPATAGNFTATGYFFGRALHQALKVPIGLVNSSVGGTAIELWTNRLVSGTDPAKRKAITDLDANSDEVRKAREDYELQLERWTISVRTSKARRKPRKPAPPAALAALYRDNGALYNGMIHPLIPYGLRGAIWYQGESNAGRAYAYRRRQAAMIQGWREAWGQGEFPFLFVQLPNYLLRKDQPGDSTWAVLRESQLRTLAVPGTGMAVTIDIGEARNIHPRNKQDVGKRLALVALAKVYGKDVVYSGPVYEKMTVEGSGVRLHFGHVAGGLVAAGGEPLKGFAIAGADKKWVWADARIDGATVVVHSDEVAKPVAVRYAWAHNPQCNLTNKEGLPASPFRTDDWWVVTMPKPQGAAKPSGAAR